MTIREKIEQGVMLTEQEVRDIVVEDIEEIKIVCTEELDSGRWQDYMRAIIIVNDKFYAVEYCLGLTEYQENEYPTQILEEVKKQTRIVEVTEYI